MVKGLLFAAVFIPNTAFIMVCYGDISEEERLWWKYKKLEAQMHQGRRVWAWELEPPKDHPMWYSRSEKPEPYRWGPEGQYDLSAFELVPRPLMPNWWCPIPCGTLNLTREPCQFHISACACDCMQLAPSLF
jgi:hypothetical protein